MGTGFVVDDKGHIVTNNHVINGANDITVELHDGRKIKAKVIGTDPRTDIAVLKVDSKDLTPAKFGNSDDLKIGEWVVASGNPFGLNNTITAGIVSAKGRSISSGVQYEDYIQTDAAINPGNSGGPLLNLNGEVIGINTAIFSRSGGHMGIGFAIPSKIAKDVITSLVEDGKVVRGWLGVLIQNLDENLAKSFNYEGTQGALVGDVTEDSPASKAKVKSGDIITEFDNQKVRDVNHLRNIVAATKPNSKVSIKIFRNGEYKELSLVLAELTDDKIKIEKSVDSSFDEIGLTVQNLSTEMKSSMGLRTTGSVIVTNVAPYSFAHDSGIQVKDIILSVNSNEVKSAKDFEKLIKESNLDEGIRLSLESDGLKRFVFLKKN
ncbi:UNVERIFIED_CONTAM: hypothetical protein GTU68_059539 [Idotea baltica]|nr:hypothetical protein [Idotea baltica]